MDAGEGPKNAVGDDGGPKHAAEGKNRRQQPGSLCHSGWGGLLSFSVKVFHVLMQTEARKNFSRIYGGYVWLALEGYATHDWDAGQEVGDLDGSPQITALHCGALVLLLEGGFQGRVHKGMEMPPRAVGIIFEPDFEVCHRGLRSCSGTRYVCGGGGELWPLLSDEMQKTRVGTNSNARHILNLFVEVAGQTYTKNTKYMCYNVTTRSCCNFIETHASTPCAHHRTKKMK